MDADIQRVQVGYIPPLAQRIFTNGNFHSNRRLDNGFNIFEGILSNYFFIGINMVMFAGQVAIIFVGGRAFSIVRITGVQWAICIGLAIISCPWAMLIRTVPDAWAERFWLACGKPVVDVLAAVWNALGAGFKRVFGRKRKGDGAAGEP